MSTPAKNLILSALICLTSVACAKGTLAPTNNGGTGNPPGSAPNPLTPGSPSSMNLKEAKILVALAEHTWCFKPDGVEMEGDGIPFFFSEKGEGQITADTVRTFEWRTAEERFIDFRIKGLGEFIPHAFEFSKDYKTLTSKMDKYKGSLTLCDPAPANPPEESFGLSDSIAAGVALVTPAPPGLEGTITRTDWCGKNVEQNRSYRMTLGSDSSARVVANLSGSEHVATGSWTKTSESTFDLKLSAFGFTKKLTVEVISKNEIVSTSSDGVKQSYRPCP